MNYSKKWKYRIKDIQITRQQIHHNLHKKKTPKAMTDHIQTFFKEDKRVIEFNLNILECLHLLNFGINIAKIIKISAKELTQKLSNKRKITLIDSNFYQLNLRSI